MIQSKILSFTLYILLNTIKLIIKITAKNTKYHKTLLKQHPAIPKKPYISPCNIEHFFCFRTSVHYFPRVFCFSGNCIFVISSTLNTRQLRYFSNNAFRCYPQNSIYKYNRKQKNPRSEKGKYCIPSHFLIKMET